MKILKWRILTGPNVWSIRNKQLVEALVDLGEFEERPTNLIDGFYDRLKMLLPSLYRHRCSEGREGGFFFRVQQGTWLGHVMEHIALELQSLADMDTGFGKTRQSDRRGVYHVVYSCKDYEAGRYAGECALQIIMAIVNKEPIDISCFLLKLKTIWSKNKLGPSTESIVNEAMKRNIPWMRLNDGSYIQLGYGKNQQRIEATIACTTGSIAVELVGDKAMTKHYLAQAHIPVPAGQILSDENELFRVVNEVGFPMVIKPLDGNHGRGATTNIQNINEAKVAFTRAKEISSCVVCEKFIQGSDFRILVVNNKFVAAAKRTPAMVTGDGLHSIQKLIDIANDHVLRGEEHENILTTIKVDAATQDMIRKAGYSLDTVLPPGKELFLKPTANISTGGTAEDVTDTVHQSNILMFERAARVLGLNICGIDVIASDLETPLSKNGGAIIEVNAAPGLRMHLQPSSGTPRNVAAPIMDMLFPDNAPSRIPIISVTGTNGKTTTTRLIAHIVKKAGYCTGYTTTDGIYIDDELIEKGDCSGPASARVILRDPGIEYAVLECARGGILRSGLGYDKSDVAVITNIAEDHLGLDGIDDLEKLAWVKSVVAEAIFDNGTAVLNADDELVLRMKDKIPGRVALFSLKEDNERIREHCGRGGVAAIYKDNSIYLIRGSKECKLEEVQNIPCTFDGKAEFNIANVLAATLACVAQRIPLSVVQQGLRTFKPGPELTPGRMNLFEFNRNKILLDYAHNPHGMKAIAGFIGKIEGVKKVGVVTAVGDRRDEDIIAVGEQAAKMFDEIVVRLDNDLRGRTSEEMNRLITQGIKRVNPQVPLTYCSSEEEAIDLTFSWLDGNQMLILLVDNIAACTEKLRTKMQSMVTQYEAVQIAV